LADAGEDDSVQKETFCLVPAAMREMRGDEEIVFEIVGGLICPTHEAP
jgi:hypothetical protein